MYHLKLRGYNCIVRYSNKLFCYITTYCTLLKGWLLGVRIGRKCTFEGFICIKRTPFGSISIGNGCRFLSRETSNNMGLNHRCMLSVSPAYKGETAMLVIGNDCGFSGVSIWCFKNILIGNNVRVGANTIIMDGDAHFDDSRTAPPASIIIEDGVFIGANCIVKKGVTIGANSVIGMNSVVTKSIPSNSIAIGNPCKVIRQINI
ncbi:acyltransferase [Xylanibacter muris]|uniref:Acyltransferase n=1 Tax=Xylanibacter muris TaxID=2736290 RepID=A0ABX2AIL9_9BACT|nr:acyltransferase [Xylanibacter muris]NPD90886.1 acyltransferase [Xylanibacter muris]